MVQFKKGVISVGPRDYVKCPWCKRTKIDGKVYYSEVSIVAVTVLPKVEGQEFEALPYIFPMQEGPNIDLPTKPERTAYDGPGLQICYCCEQGHSWQLNIAMHGDRAIQFVEVIDQGEPELEEAEIAEDEDEDNE